MRGIGKGQTVGLYMIPEVQQLIQIHVSKARGETVAEYRQRVSGLVPGARHGQMLKDVASWLILNSMHSEKIQFNLLCEHSVRNIFRKTALRVRYATVAPFPC